MDYYQAPPQAEFYQYVGNQNEQITNLEYAIAAGGCCSSSSGGCPAPSSKPARSKEKVKEQVREAYGSVAEANDAGEACGNGQNCCGVPAFVDVDYAIKLGYSKEDVESVPEGANMGLGCGNPQAVSEINKGEVVLDLGAGGGFDAFLAAQRVGDEGSVIGVDMTPAMVSKARLNAEKNNYRNINFLLGEIEHLPVANSTVDVIISNCVVNLSTDKLQVFKEAFRVLKDGGRLAISDILSERSLPEHLANNAELYCGCVSGAISVNELEQILTQAGFEEISIEIKEKSREFLKGWYPGTGVEKYVVSANVRAVKPKSN